MRTLIATLPYRSPQYKAAVEADKAIEAEYEAAKQEALSLHQAPQPLAAQPQEQPTPPADPYAAFPIVGRADKSQWDKRADGSEKGMGWLGLRQRPDGGVSSELSADFGSGDIPVMVPGLTPDELHWLMTTTDRQQIAGYRNHDPIASSVRSKAVQWAQQRKAQGLSPFRQPGEPSVIPAVNAAEQGQ